MTQIDFYVLNQATAIARFHYACRLSEKALNQGHHIAITLDNKEHAQTLSDYLWSFKPESFLPHSLQDAEGSSSDEESPNHKSKQAPIALLWGEDNEKHHDILINLGNKIPEGFSRYQRTFEIVIQEDECLKTTRSHFQFYRERGYPLKSHTVG